jgi:hypothetical protein
VHLSCAYFLASRCVMPKITGPFWAYKRPKTKEFQLTFYPASGLPLEVCKRWQRQQKAATDPAVK